MVEKCRNYIECELKRLDYEHDMKSEVIGRLQGYRRAICHANMLDIISNDDYDKIFMMIQTAIDIVINN